MQQLAAGGRHGRHVESLTSTKYPTPSIDAYLLEEQSPIRFETTVV